MEYSVVCHFQTTPIGVTNAIGIKIAVLYTSFFTNLDKLDDIYKD